MYIRNAYLIHQNFTHQNFPNLSLLRFSTFKHIVQYSTYILLPLLQFQLRLLEMLV